MSKRLRAPFPWFGGKSTIAATVWKYLGNVDNFIEPFAGSAAVLLLRPTPPKIETLNDKDCYVANFWRATSKDPEAVAAAADWPVNECDMHSRHKWLVLSDDAKIFRKRMREDPDYFDVKVAGWWCWGLCCWIGGGWCKDDDSAEWEQIPAGQRPLTGVHSANWQQIPLIGGSNYGPSQSGVHSLTNGPVGGSGQRSVLLGGGGNQYGHGIHAQGRPQLADVYARGRGVHGNDAAGTCEQRRTWLLDWFNRLRDRLRTVRVCCGDWLRVCNSESVTTRLGRTGIFFDPPYGVKARRSKHLYSTDSLTVAADARAYCLERGQNKQMRIVLAGYEDEGHEELENHGWSCVKWKAQGGYGNRSKQGKENAKKERLWISPHCKQKEEGFGL